MGSRTVASCVPALYFGNSVHLGQQFLGRGNVEVALQQRGKHAVNGVGLVEQGPHVLDHGRGVGIHDQVFGFVVVAGDVPVGDPFARQAAQK